MAAKLKSKKTPANKAAWFALVDDLFAADEKVGDAKEGWIAGAIKRPGQLHRDLGVPQGKKIPLGVVQDAAKRKGKVGARARLALTLRKFR